MIDLFKVLFGIGDWMPVIAALVGAFAAGIVAFAVTRCNERINRHRKLWNGHYDGLVALLLQLAELRVLLISNIELVNQVIEAPSQKGGAMQVASVEPHELLFDRDILLTLMRNEISNAAFSVLVNMRKANYDAMMQCRAYERMCGAMLTKNLAVEQYGNSLEVFKLGLKRLTVKYDRLFDYLLSLIAMTRVAVKKDDPKKLHRYFHMPHPENLTEEAVNGELKLLREEIEGKRSHGKSSIDKSK